MSLYQKLKVFLRSWIPFVKTALVGAGLITVLLLLNWENPAYIGVNPHPYLLLAIFFSLLQGVRASLFMNPALALLYMVLLYFTVDPQKVEQTFSLQAMILPVSFVMIPAVVSVVVDRLKGEVRKKEGDISDKSAMIQDLQEFNEIMGREKDDMGRRLASQAHTVTRVFEFAHSLETTDLKEIAEALVSITCDEMGEDNCYVYIFDQADLHCMAFRDENDERKLPELIDAFEVPTYGLIDQAIQQLDVVKAHDVAELGQGFEKYAIAAPLVAVGDEVTGVLVVRKLHFLNCLPSTFSNFHSLSQWGGMCIGRAKRVLQARANSYRDEETGLFSFEYFQQRIERAFHRAKKYSFNLSALRFEFKEIASFQADERFAVLKMVSSCLARPQDEDIDHVAIGEEVGVFHVMMTLAGEESVHRYIAAVKKEIDELNPHLGSLKVTYDVYQSILSKAHQDEDEFLQDEQQVDPNELRSLETPQKAESA